MGNEHSECSVKHAAQECAKTTGLDDWSPGQGRRLEYTQADEANGASGLSHLGGPLPEVLGASLDEKGHSRGLSVEHVGRKGLALVHAEQVTAAPDHAQKAAALATGSDARDAAHSDASQVLVKTYFDCEVGEAPPHHDASDSDRSRADHTFRTGAVYSGEWLHGERDGIGRQQWLDGTVYIGEWAQGRANGKGQLIHVDGDSYVGLWLDGRAHGLGVYEFSHGAATYLGEFQHDLREGLGKEEWKEEWQKGQGSIYCGEFKKSMKCGYGVNKWPNDSAIYQGSWYNNELQGPGFFSVESGSMYRGQWEHSAPNGMGCYQWADGSKYEGKYRMDKKHGFGVFTEANNDGPPMQGYWIKGERVNTLPRGKE